MYEIKITKLIAVDDTHSASLIGIHNLNYLFTHLKAIIIFSSPQLNRHA